MSQPPEPLKRAAGCFYLDEAVLPAACDHLIRWYRARIVSVQPSRRAEYVVAHEIAHLYESPHTPASWLRVERAMPDYAQRKAWLAEHGMEVEGL